jgi:hypothetical protein
MVKRTANSNAPIEIIAKTHFIALINNATNPNPTKYT